MVQKYITWTFGKEHKGFINIIEFSDKAQPDIFYNVTKEKYLLVENFDPEIYDNDHKFYTKINMNQQEDSRIVYNCVIETINLSDGLPTYQIILTGSLVTLLNQLKSYMANNLYNNYLENKLEHDLEIKRNINLLKKQSLNVIDIHGKNLTISLAGILLSNK